MTDQPDPAPDQDGGASARGGRPSKFPGIDLDLVRQLAKAGAVDLTIAEAIGIGLSTLYRYKAEYPEFRDALKQGKAVADDAVVSALFRRATGYSHDAVKHVVVSDGRGEGSHVEAVEYVEHVPPDTTAAIFWLKNRRPKDWRDKQEVQHEAGDTLTKFLAELDGKTRGIPGA